MAIILFDNALRGHLYPFTATRAVAAIRTGILTMQERWAKISGEPVFIHTAPTLQAQYELLPTGEHCWIDAAWFPDADGIDRVLSLEPGCCLADETGLLAGRISVDPVDFHASSALSLFSQISDFANGKRWIYPWHLVQYNDAVLRFDFRLLTEGRSSALIPTSVQVIQEKDIFIEEGAELQHCIINAATGPVYIGPNAVVMEGTAIRGPFSMGEHAVLKLNSRIYGATTIGPYCMGGGEIKNSILMEYSNKAHDGYLGDSVVGAWCNFGAGSTCSNVKNTAAEVKVWNAASGEYISAGQKCGVIMGDYSRVAINSSINTGSVIGVSCNVFGAGLLPTIIPDFSWGVQGIRYEFEKALRDIDNWKKMKGQRISDAEAAILQPIFAQSQKR
jgi:UDP-N-acetylglucosamine diphosphorylase/glucosamine-1-phosphate N-acetyltransferase